MQKTILNTKAVKYIGWSKKEQWRRTQRLAEDWQKQQKGMNLVKLNNTMASLKKSQVGTRGELDNIFGGDYSEFTKFASMPEHLCILVNNGKVLGYRVRYDQKSLGELATPQPNCHLYLLPAPREKILRNDMV